MTKQILHDREAEHFVWKIESTICTEGISSIEWIKIENKIERGREEKNILRKKVRTKTHALSKFIWIKCVLAMALCYLYINFYLHSFINNSIYINNFWKIIIRFIKVIFKK